MGEDQYRAWNEEESGQPIGALPWAPGPQLPESPLEIQYQQSQSSEGPKTHPDSSVSRPQAQGPASLGLEGLQRTTQAEPVTVPQCL